MMGSPADEEGHEEDEVQHRVQVRRPFYLGRYEVTQKQWQQVMGTDLKTQDAKDGSTDRPWEGVKGEGENFPMYHISWEEAVEFCAKLTAKQRESGQLPAGYVYTLPTEAQWEYACRAGTTTPFAMGNSLTSDDANFLGEATQQVGTYPPNAWKLHDMHGNVWEWCWDWFGDYDEQTKTAPSGLDTGRVRVVRGGGWFNDAGYCRSAFRIRSTPDNRDVNLGFRVAAVREIELQERKGAPRVIRPVYPKVFGD